MDGTAWHDDLAFVVFRFFAHGILALTLEQGMTSYSFSILLHMIEMIGILLGLAHDFALDVLRDCVGDIDCNCALGWICRSTLIRSHYKC